VKKPLRSIFEEDTPVTDSDNDDERLLNDPKPA
jgi:hypothetical protein